MQRIIRSLGEVVQQSAPGLIEPNQPQQTNGETMNPAFEFGHLIGVCILVYAAYRLVRWGVRKSRRNGPKPKVSDGGM